MAQPTRWKVTASLDGSESEPEPYEGQDDDGSATLELSRGAAWRGIGPTPKAAAVAARKGRSMALPDLEELFDEIEDLIAERHLKRHAGARLPSPNASLVARIRFYLGTIKVPADIRRVTPSQLVGWRNEVGAAVGERPIGP